MKVFSLSNRFYYREFPDLKNTSAEEGRESTAIIFSNIISMKGFLSTGESDRK